MKRKEIHVAAIHAYLIHNQVFKSLGDASKFFGLNKSICGAVFRGEVNPNQVMRDKLKVPDGVHVHAARVHRYEIHHKTFESLKEAGEYFDMTACRCGHVFRGSELPTWGMINKLGIKHMIER